MNYSTLHEIFLIWSKEFGSNSNVNKKNRDSEILELLDNLNVLQFENGVLEKKMKIKNREIEELKAKVKIYKKEEKVKENKLDQLTKLHDERLQEIMGDLENLKESVAFEKREKTDLEKQTLNLEHELAEEYKIREEVLDKKEGEIEQLKSRLEVIKEENSKLVSTNERLSSEILDMKREQMRLKHSQKIYQSNYSKMQQIFKENEASTEFIKKELASKEFEHKNLRKSMVKMKDVNSKLIDKLKAQGGSQKEISKQIENYQEVLDIEEVTENSFGSTSINQNDSAYKIKVNRRISRITTEVLENLCLEAMEDNCKENLSGLSASRLDSQILLDRFESHSQADLVEFSKSEAQTEIKFQLGSDTKTEKDEVFKPKSKSKVEIIPIEIPKKDEEYTIKEPVKTNQTTRQNQTRKNQNRKNQSGSKNIFGQKTLNDVTHPFKNLLSVQNANETGNLATGRSRSKKTSIFVSNLHLDTTRSNNKENIRLLLSKNNMMTPRGSRPCSFSTIEKSENKKNKSRKIKFEAKIGNIGETLKNPKEFRKFGKDSFLKSKESEIREKAVREIVKRLKMLNPFIFSCEEVFEKCDEIIDSPKEICGILDLVFKFFEKKLQDFWKKQTELKSKLSKIFI